MSVMNWLVALLFLWGLQDGTQACTCLPSHPQEIFCHSDVVFSALIRGVQHGGAYNQPIQYDVQLTRYFKGPRKLFFSIYTASSSAACGVVLEKDTEYLIMAKVHPDGKVHFSSCDFYHPWKTLSSAQQENLWRFPRGCHCKIKNCYSSRCPPSGRKECQWTDFLGQSHDACLKKRGGFCKWHREVVRPTRPWKFTSYLS
ncbi:metalloproteinase inhibitor 2-like [Stigmatopora nigra]